MSRLTFLYQMDLPHRAVAVYTYLHDRANKNGECWPSVKTIAGDIKLSPATVRRAIKDLKKVGLIETKQRYREHGGKSSLLYKMFNRQNNNNKSNCKTFIFAISFRFLIPSIRSHLVDISIIRYWNFSLYNAFH